MPRPPPVVLARLAGQLRRWAHGRADSSLLGLSPLALPGRWPGRALTEGSLAQRRRVLGISPGRAAVPPCSPWPPGFSPPSCKSLGILWVSHLSDRVREFAFSVQAELELLLRLMEQGKDGSPLRAGYDKIGLLLQELGRSLSPWTGFCSPAEDSATGQQALPSQLRRAPKDQPRQLLRHPARAASGQRGQAPGPVPRRPCLRLAGPALLHPRLGPRHQRHDRRRHPAHHNGRTDGASAKTTAPAVELAVSGPGRLLRFLFDGSPDCHLWLPVVPPLGYAGDTCDCGGEPF